MLGLSATAYYEVDSSCSDTATSKDGSEFSDLV